MSNLLNLNCSNQIEYYAREAAKNLIQGEGNVSANTALAMACIITAGKVGTLIEKVLKGISNLVLGAVTLNRSKFFLGGWQLLISPPLKVIQIAHYALFGGRYANQSGNSAIEELEEEQSLCCYYAAEQIKKRKAEGLQERATCFLGRL